MSLLVIFTLLLSQALAAHQPTHHRLRKRFSGAATYYDVGLGACGGTNVPSDFIVALNAPQFDDAGSGYPNPICGKSLTITHNGKTAQAAVVDKCPGCAYGDLDMSQGLFEYFESTGVGRFSMSWDWGNAAPAPAPTTSKDVPPAPTTSAAPPPPPSPTTTTHSTTTQAAAPTTSSSNSPTTSSSSSSSSGSDSISSSSSGSATSSSPSPQPSVNPYGTGDDNSGLPGNIIVMQEAVVNFGSLIRHAAGQI